MDAVFKTLTILNHLVWSHVAFFLIVGMGFYFSFRTGFFQVRRFGSIMRSFFGILMGKSSDERGVHPFKVFFAAIGGCIGIGNVVGICTAVEIGGPGAVFWVWIGGLCGMLIQYSEVYLGLKYRVKNSAHNYDGGPMYYLPIAYKMKWLAPLVCILLAAYGIEIFMFNVMADSISVNWGIELWIVVTVLCFATFAVALGGIKRVGEVCGAIIPLFIILYFFMCAWVLAMHASELPHVFKDIFYGAFTTQAAQGGFVGSTVSLAISTGLSRGAYSGDIGVGYTSIIYAESQTRDFQRLSCLTIVGIFLDTFVICTLSVLVVLATGIWNTGIDVSLMVQESLALHFPLMQFFMPFFLFLLGYTTLLAYFVVGVKCAKYLSPKWGPPFYYLCGAIALPLFAFTKANHAFTVMSLLGAMLLLINLFGMFLLRKKIVFGLGKFDLKR